MKLFDLTLNVMFDIYTVKFIKNIIEKSCFYMLTQQYFLTTNFIIFIVNNKIMEKDQNLT